MSECNLCGDEWKSVVHVLWEFPAYKDSRDELMVRLKAILGEGQIVLRILLLC